ncbi:MAG: acyl-CoA dehydrogenase family protein [Nocardioides sp.]|uniref:acyl-CoA dehydrogenase family protein n=1 Tax=Nocardioides sp. TaxID=35761 RepID=UPI0039E4DF46
MWHSSAIHEKDIQPEYLTAARELRQRFEETAGEVDRRGTYPEENMQLIGESALRKLQLPRSVGGNASDNPIDDIPTTVQLLKHLGAGEPSTAQIWIFSRDLSVMLTGESSPLPMEVRQELAREVRENGARFCAPSAERYSKRYDFRVPIRRVEGGVVISGTKYFATGCAGSRYAHSFGLMEGYSSVMDGGGHNVLVDMQSPGVEVHDDWDNMGQRASSSGSVTYHDVFVPDGYHWAPPNGGFNKNPNDPTGVVAPFALAPIMLGIGLGALDVVSDFLQNRSMYKGALEDNSISYQLGLHAVRLAAAEALLMEAVRHVTAYFAEGLGTRAEAALAGSRAKVAVSNAVLEFTADMQKFLGGQSTSNAYRYDRFWRNVRTLTLQDVIDIRVKQIGAWALKGEEPEVSWTS